jgi:NADH-quinone oxidoreductase subunit N
MGSPAMLLPLLPEILLVILSLFVLGLDLSLKEKRPVLLGWITVCRSEYQCVGRAWIAHFAHRGTVGVGGNAPPGQGGASFPGDLPVRRGDHCTTLSEEEALSNHGEFYFLLVLSTLGLTLLASSADLIMVYLSLELASIPLYILAGFNFRDSRSVESGLKYMLYGAVASTIMLFGFTFLYGFSGTQPSCI